MAVLLGLAVVVAVAVVGAVPSAVALDGPLPAPLGIQSLGVDGTLRLERGGVLCLPGIRVPPGDGESAGWRSAWRDIIDKGVVRQQADPGLGADRYGCAFVRLDDANGVTLQNLLIDAGWAIADPVSAPDEGGVIDVMLHLEEGARRARRGMWRGERAMVKEADDLSRWIGTHQIVEGRVRRVSDNDRYVYLNFGADWRTDFTVRVSRRLMETAGRDHDSFLGRHVRVRGVVQDSRGPLIDISHLKQIEFLP